MLQIRHNFFFILTTVSRIEWMENSPISGLRMWRRICNLDCYRVSLRSSRFLSFPGGDRTRERKSGQAKKHAWHEQNIREKWGGGEREGGESGGGEN